MKKELEMDIEWRTVQMFISENGVAEVEIDAENHNKVRCSCKSFLAQARCKHVKFVKDRMDNADGMYSVQIPEEVPDSEAISAMADPSLWREFILKHGEVEIL